MLIYVVRVVAFCSLPLPPENLNIINIYDVCALMYVLTALFLMENLNPVPL